mmetsp:Transcript_28892/g.63632  ORF Transcript_28892/g.63632 Transcript_28892/m.63632 type:complete len:174 (+) Transcript_28892:44-565(+)
MGDPEFLFGTQLLEGVKGDIAEVEKQIFTVESASYPEDEKASPESIHLRMHQVPHMFLVAFDGPAVVGYICSTRSVEGTLTEESISHDAPSGKNVCIHSVCVAEQRRRQGLALKMLAKYKEHLASLGKDVCERALLMCKQNLVELYTKGGFTMVGPSPVVHGADQWFEMKMDF